MQPAIVLSVAVATDVFGAHARNHVVEMCPHQGNRPAEEYR
jgi:hypothetical protein